MEQLKNYQNRTPKLNLNEEPLHHLETINQEFEIAYEGLKNYIENLNINKELKEIILDKNLKSSNYIYFLFPRLFSDAYLISDKKQIELLCHSGFFHFMFTKYLDDFIDFDSKKLNENKKGYLFRLLIYQFYSEHAIQSLGELFSKENAFWIERSKKIKSYIKFLINEQANEFKVSNINDYENLASSKSQLSFLALDALFCMSSSKDKKETHKKCIQINHKLSFILQALDDILDLEEDFDNNQCNLIIALAKINCEKIEPKELKIKSYQDGTITTLLSLVLEHLDEINLLLTDFKKMFQLKFFVQKTHNKIVKEILNIRGYNFYVNILNEIEGNFFKQAKGECPAQKGLNYIFSKQENEGNWIDFFNSAGLSDVWSTAFILCHLNPKTRSYQSEIKKAVKFLQNTINPDNGWGYNRSWVSDTDSTSFAILAMYIHNEKLDNKIFENWVSQQQSNGGFTTYPNSSELSISLNIYLDDNEIFSGWTQSHFCVSASAFYLLSRINKTEFQSQKKRLYNYLLTCIELDEDRAYWWRNSIYAFHSILNALEHEFDEYLFKIIESKIQKHLIIDDVIKNLKHENNFFFISQTMESIVILNKYHPSSKYLTKIESLKSFLIKKQKPDGSWSGSLSLRIPAPHIINPDDNNIKWEEKNTGGNTLYRDFNNLFTTITCVNAIDKYNRSIKKMCK